MNFIIRVYGILQHEGHILVSQESYRGLEMFKFPGGGLKWGEGITDALLREFMEETGQVVTIQSHFYTTEYFQPSAFDPTRQVISVYYRVSHANPDVFETGVKLPGEKAGDWIVLNWLPVEQVLPEYFTYPIEQEVARRLQHEKL